MSLSVLCPQCLVPCLVYNQRSSYVCWINVDHLYMSDTLNSKGSPRSWNFSCWPNLNNYPCVSAFCLVASSIQTSNLQQKVHQLCNGSPKSNAFEWKSFHYSPITPGKSKQILNEGQSEPDWPFSADWFTLLLRHVWGSHSLPATFWSLLCLFSGLFSGLPSL